MNSIFKTASLNAIGTALYVAFLVSLISCASNIFGQSDPETILVPIIMLLLFVFSAAVTGFLVFGRVILWYLDGQKKEAMSLLGYTFLVLFIIIIFAVVTLLAISL